MSTPRDDNVKCGILSIQIDANSRAPVHRRSSALKDRRDEDTSSKTTSCSGTSSPISHISFRAVGEPDGAPLLRCSPRGTAHKRAIADEWEISEEAEHSRRKVSNRVRAKIGKARRVIAKEIDERREIRNLLQRCRNDDLSSRVLHIDSAPCKRKRSTSDPTTPTSTDGSDTQPLCADLPDLSPNVSRIVSRTSRASSINSIFSVTPRRKSSTPTTPGSDKDPSPRTPLRQRRISRPLELDPQFQASQLPPLPENERSESVSPAKPTFRTPDWAPPTQDDCIACEIVRTITRQTIPAAATGNGKETEKASCKTRTFRKMSDARGYDMFEQIQDTDAKGRKKVLLQWGQGIDDIIPPQPNHQPVDGALKARLSSRFEGLGRKAKNLKARAWNKVRGLNEALYFSPYMRIKPTGSEA